MLENPLYYIDIYWWQKKPMYKSGGFHFFETNLTGSRPVHEALCRVHYIKIDKLIAYSALVNMSASSSQSLVNLKHFIISSLMPNLVHFVSGKHDY